MQQRHAVSLEDCGEMILVRKAGRQSDLRQRSIPPPELRDPRDAPHGATLGRT
jgi:hypothetical protein